MLNNEFVYHGTAVPECRVFSVEVDDNFVGTAVSVMFDVLKMRLPCNKLVEELSPDEVTRYLKTLIELKIDVTNEANGKGPRQLRDLKVPFWFADILAKLGVCHYPEENIVIRPTKSVRLGHPMDRSECVTMSRKLALLGDHYQMEPAPYSVKGEEGFMELLTMNDDTLRSHRQQDGLDVFLSLIVQKKLLEEVMSDYFRISYGYASCLCEQAEISNLPRYVNDKAKGGTKHE